MTKGEAMSEQVDVEMDGAKVYRLVPGMVITEIRWFGVPWWKGFRRNRWRASLTLEPRKDRDVPIQR